MPNKTWKAVEKDIARYGWNVERRGADFGGTSGGKNDVLMEGWSIEVKYGKKIGLALIKAAIAQAELAAEPGDIVCAVIKQHGDATEDSIVCMKLKDFKENFAG